jgi:hypothetical protein
MHLVHVSDSLTDVNAKTHLPHRFELPAGATRLHVDLQYGPQEIVGLPGNNLLSLSLFDPHGSRGAGHCREDNRIDLSAAHATPGYVPGPLTAGAWAVIIDVHMVVPGGKVDYTLDIRASFDPVDGDSPRWATPTLAQRGPGWYRGDLHGHTIHSDASWDVPDLVAAARAAGLDFVTLSDHNTISPLAQMDSLATDDLLTMGGIELTTYHGHALALGLRQWIDWRTTYLSPGERTMPKIAEEVMALGGTYIIAHPKSIGDPYCTGCDWRYDDMMPGVARIVEIWNGVPWEQYNEDGLALYYTWLNQGYRLAATSGTDTHGPDPLYPQAGFNHVYAQERSEAAILAAIRQGHNYMSAGPKLTFTAHMASGERGMMGDELPNEGATVACQWHAATPGERLRFVVDGLVREELPINAAGERTWSLAAGECRWCTLEVRSADGLMRAVTNPIFFAR